MRWLLDGGTERIVGVSPALICSSLICKSKTDIGKLVTLDHLASFLGALLRITSLIKTRIKYLLLHKSDLKQQSFIILSLCGSGLAESSASGSLTSQGVSQGYILI